MKKPGFRRGLALALGLLLAALCLGGCGGAYPAKSIRVICPWSAGGGTDACLRAFAKALGGELGQTLRVENLAKDGGVAGHQAIADADADGYTLGMITFELATYAPLGVSELTWEDYEPLCRVNTDAATVTVNAAWAQARGIADLPSFVDYCAAHPGQVQLGGSSSASVWHMAGRALMEETGVEVEMVTYEDGGVTAVRNAASGLIQGTTVSLAEAGDFVRSGHLLCLGVMAQERVAIFPDVPTCAEQGFDLTCSTQRGLALPKGVEPEIRDVLADACARAIEDPDFVAFMESKGHTIAYLNAEDYAAFLQEEARQVAAALAEP